MVKTKHLGGSRRPSSLKPASTSSKGPTPVDPVEPEAPLQLESLPSTNVDDQGESDIIEDPPRQVERRVYWMVDVIGMISILNGMI